MYCLNRVHNISTWCYGDTTKAVISLDLDLYEKCYLLVTENSSLQDKSIFCLGELHPVFAHSRAIGKFINGSGLKKAWQVAGWFDSSAVVREIIERTHMKRAVATHARVHTYETGSSYTCVICLSSLVSTTKRADLVK